MEADKCEFEINVQTLDRLKGSAAVALHWSVNLSLPEQQELN